MHSNTQVFTPIGKCIYCGTTKSPLGKEHIIPLGLAGNLILPKASCASCARITGEIERFCLREMFGDMRIRHRFPTRRPASRKSTLPIYHVHSDGTRDVSEVRADDYPSTCFGYHFASPAILGEPDSKGNHKIELIFVTLLPELTKHHRTGTRTAMKLGHFNTLTFMRMIAKIAHSYAVARLGQDSFTPLLLPIILGQTNEASWLIGADLGRDAEPPDSACTHDLYLDHVLNGGTKYLAASVRLFSAVGMPYYYAIVGVLK